MTPERLTAVLEALHWSVRGLAVVLDEHETAVRRWVSGQTAVPRNVAVWLEVRARTAFSRPQPKGWIPRAERKLR